MVRDPMRLREGKVEAERTGRDDERESGKERNDQGGERLHGCCRGSQVGMFAGEEREQKEERNSRDERPLDRPQQLVQLSSPGSSSSSGSLS